MKRQKESDFKKATGFKRALPSDFKKATSFKRAGKLFTVEAIAELSGLAKVTVSQDFRKGALRGGKVFGRWVATEREVRAYRGGVCL